MKLCMISLGCDKNLVDSEMMLGQLAEQNYEFIDDEEAADVIIVNTCCFILDAKEESINTILRVAEYKHGGCLKKLIVTGCLAERYRDEIIAEIPEVDEVIGIGDLEKKLKENPPKHRYTSTGGWYGYLKIADGCDKRCTYCIIPYLRGGFRSYPMDDLVNQAVELAEGGVKELILVAQETTMYGTDLYGRKMLPELLRRLCAIEELKWIRILYTYPEEIDDELIEVMATEKKICHYLDMPIQHASDKILKRMGRRTTRADIIEKVKKLRERIPDIALRTTLISGFPGETEDDHHELVDFVKEMRFERLGVFCYSAEEGTPAAEFENQMPEELKEARRDEIMCLQQVISTEALESKVGKNLNVIIEGYIPEDKICVGRTYMDTPDIDGYIFINTKKRYDSGAFIDVKVTGSSEYDLMGEEL